MRKVKCQDGTSRHVYKDPDMAFPLALRDISSTIKAQVDAAPTITANLSASNEQRYTTLLVGIDESNNTLQANYRAAYMVFAANPCQGYDKFAAAVERLEKTHGDRSKLLVRAQLIQNMILANADGGNIQEAIAAAFEVLRPSAVTETYQLVQEVPQLVEKWGNPK